MPATLWLSGWLGGPQTKSARQPAPDPVAAKKVEVKVVKVEPPPPPAPVAAPKAVERPKPRVEELLAQAKQRIDNGDILGTRKILENAPETAAPAAMTFLFAETYDPNMLAIWQARGLVTADVQKARMLYQKALALGDTRAEHRLQPHWLGAK